MIFLTALGDISPSNHLILNLLFWRTQPQFVRFIFSLMTRQDGGNELLSIFFSGIWLIFLQEYFKKTSFPESSCFFPYTSQINFSMSLIYFLLIVFFSPSSLNMLIAIELSRTLFKGLTFPLRLNDAVKLHPAKA